MQTRKQILVTKSFVPPLEEYVAQLAKVWDSRWLTNNGPLALDLEKQLATYLGVKYVFFTGNGTIAIQIALKALDITKEVITTPFSYVATTNSLLWEHCKPVFVDIDPLTYCIDPKKIEEKITKDTQAILAVHVYGQPCDVKTIEKIAKKHNLKVIYDAAHAFDVSIDNTSVFTYGDISTLSFHATKLFHTGEGGAIVTNDDALAAKIKLYRSFGHVGDEYYSEGINGKNSEIHAALGLTNLPYVKILEKLRKKISDHYDVALQESGLENMHRFSSVKYNYAYYPVVFRSESDLQHVRSALEKKNISTRRYFYPSLNTLPFLTGESCPVSESIALRVLCLPLYHDLSLKDARLITQTINTTLQEIRDKERSLPTLSVGIPVHNESFNISSLVRSIFSQSHRLYQLEKIYIINDGSTDDTVKNVISLQKQYKKVVLLDEGNRRGKAARLNELYRINTSDFLLTLDGDVQLIQKNVIDTLITKAKQVKAGVIAANLTPAGGQALVEKFIVTYFRIWDEVRNRIPNGDHIANLFGSATLLTDACAKAIVYPNGITCDEEYLYMTAKQGAGFAYEKNALVNYRTPKTLKDLWMQGSRFHSERHELLPYFGEKVLEAHSIPLKYKLLGILAIFIEEPAFVLLAVAYNMFIKLFPYKDHLIGSGMWQQAISTKMGGRA